MSIRNLDKMFRPRSIAIIGASDKARSVGAALMTNLLHAGFRVPIVPVNPKTDAVHGIKAFAHVASLPAAPDLAVIATRPTPCLRWSRSSVRAGPAPWLF